MSQIKRSILKRRGDSDRPLSAMTCARLQEIAAQIQAHANNIAYLQSRAFTHPALRGIGFQKIRAVYSGSSADQTRLQRTLANLLQQIEVLRYEEEVLKRYGR